MNIRSIKPARKQSTLGQVSCGVRAVMTELCNAGIQNTGKSFSMAYFEVAPGGFSEPHEHTVSEIWCITAGKAEVIADGVTLNIEAGSFVYIEPGSSHQLRNVGSETIKAVSVWWSPEDHNADS